MLKHYLKSALVVLAMMGGTQVFASSWSLPTPKFTAMVDNEASATAFDTMYVYNVGQKLFLSAGEAWGTQAVVDTLSSEAFATVKLDDGTYKIMNLVRSGKYLFRTTTEGKIGSGNRACFIDGGDANNTWYITASGDGYQIKMTEQESDYDATWFLGCQLDHASDLAASDYGGITYGVYFDVTEGDNALWKFVTKADYEVYAAKVDLLGVMEQAESLGISTSAAETVYNNADATVAEVDAARETLSAAIVAVASVDNPLDVTSVYFKNPDFNSSHDGWITTMIASNDNAAIQNNALATNRVTDTNVNANGYFSGSFWENWDGSTMSGLMYQTGKDMPSGLYKVQIAGFVNTLDENNATNKKQYVFANDSKSYFTTTNNEQFSMWADVTDTLAVGLAADSAIANWNGLDNLVVTYYGGSIESYQYLGTVESNKIDTLLAAWEGDANIIYNTQYLTDAQSAAEAIKTATTKDAAMEAYATAEAAYDALVANEAAYADLVTAYDNAYNEYMAGAYSEELEELLEGGDNGVGTAGDMRDKHTATTEEVLAMIETLETAVDDAKKSALQAGDDATSLITNPTFNDESETPSSSQAQSWDGWTVEGTRPGAGGNTDTRLAEGYQIDFDIHQTITGMQAGAYELSIQAFERLGFVDNAYTRWANGDSTTLAWIYMGAAETNIKSIFTCNADADIQAQVSGGWSTPSANSEIFVPNYMTSAYALMAADENNYKNTVVGVVTEAGGDMTIGIRASDPDATSGRWVIFHDFTMTYLGNDPTYLKPVLDQLIATATETASQNMAAEDKTNLNTALAAAETASAGSDGDAMLSAYRALADALDSTTASVEAYAALATTLDSLSEQITTAQNSSATFIDANALTDAQTLYSEVYEEMTSGTIATADVPATQTEIRDAIKNLMKLAGSDTNAADYTGWIQNPTFGATTGWTINKIDGTGTPGIQYNTMEGWNCNFDVYQDITGLPEGTYQVKVKNFFRPVSANDNWLDAVGDSIGDNTKRAKIYANSDTITANNIMDKAYWEYNTSGTNPNGESWSTCVDSVTVAGTTTNYYFANNRSAARTRFDNGVYESSFYTYVNASGNLRIGFCNKELVVQDWFVTSDWELYYLGTESSHESATGITEVNADEKVNFNEIYTVDGRRINSLQQGINIVRGTTSDGKVVTKKVYVK